MQKSAENVHFVILMPLCSGFITFEGPGALSGAGGAPKCRPEGLGTGKRSIARSQDVKSDCGQGELFVRAMEIMRKSSAPGTTTEVKGYLYDKTYD